MWDVSNVTEMNSMFSGAKDFNQNIGDWNVSKVTKADRMFTESGIAGNKTIACEIIKEWGTKNSVFSDSNSSNIFGETLTCNH